MQNEKSRKRPGWPPEHPLFGFVILHFAFCICAEGALAAVGGSSGMPLPPLPLCLPVRRRRKIARAKSEHDDLEQ
jgi:hypothetical protein